MKPISNIITERLKFRIYTKLNGIRLEEFDFKLFESLNQAVKNIKI